jgi:hypothetical protein
MSVLELTPEEARLLECALRAYEETLLLEVSNASERAVRDGLKRRDTLLRSLIERVRAEIPEPVATD